MEDQAASWHPWFVIVVIVLMFIGLVSGWKTPEMVAFMALCAVWNAGIIDTKDAVSGFTNTGVLAVGVLFVVVQAVERSQLAHVMARHAFGMDTGVRFGLARLCMLCFSISGFLNNTPVVALLTPITRDWARTRGFFPSTFLIPLSYSTIFGGLLTMVGTSTNLVVMGLAENMDLQTPGFFDIALVGLPIGVIGIIYLVLMGPILLPKTGGLFRYAKDNQKELVTEVQVDKSFKHLGQPAGLALAMLGLHRDCLVKIRRRRLRIAHTAVTPPDSSESQVPMSKDDRPAGPGSLAGCESSTTTGEGATPGVPIMIKHVVPAPEGSVADGREENGGANGGEEGTEVGQEGAGVGEMARKRRGGGGGGGGDAADARDAGKEGQQPMGVRSKRVMFDNGDAERGKGLKKNGEDAEVGGLGEPGQQVRLVRGGFVDLYPVSMNELLQEGDILFMSGGRTTFMSLHNSINNGAGLKILESAPEDLAGEGMEFVEVVLSQRNPFVGDIMAASSFGQHYGISILAIRQKGHQTEQVACIERPQHIESRLSFDRFSLDSGRRSPRVGPMDYARLGASASESPAPAAPRVTSRPPPDIFPGFDGALARRLSGGAAEEGGGVSAGGSEQVVDAEAGEDLGGEAPAGEEDKGNMEVAKSKLFGGDVVLALAPEGFAEKWQDKEDFLMVSTIGNVPKPIAYYDYVPVAIFAGMIAWVAADREINMVQAAMAAAALNVLGGWVDAKLAVSFVPWSLMLLIGSMLGVSTAIANSGLAEMIASGVKNSGAGPQSALFFIYAVTNMMTELTTNNAAAGLIFPVAISVAQKLEVSYTPFLFCVMYAASASFMTPIGYQTNMMVWGPGGYKIIDFFKIGAPLSAIYLVGCCTLIPIVWPFADGPMVPVVGSE